MEEIRFCVAKKTISLKAPIGKRALNNLIPIFRLGTRLGSEPVTPLNQFCSIVVGSVILHRNCQISAFALTFHNVLDKNWHLKDRNVLCLMFSYGFDVLARS